ncbi:hypothetical protein [Streptomyces sp. NPDC002078]
MDTSAGMPSARARRRATRRFQEFLPLLWLRADVGAVAIVLVLGVCALITGGLWLAAAWPEYRTRAGRGARSWTGPASGARVTH